MGSCCSADAARRQRWKERRQRRIPAGGGQASTGTGSGISTQAFASARSSPHSCDNSEADASVDSSPPQAQLLSLNIPAASAGSKRPSTITRSAAVRSSPEKQRSGSKGVSSAEQHCLNDCGSGALFSLPRFEASSSWTSTERTEGGVGAGAASSGATQYDFSLASSAKNSSQSLVSDSSTGMQDDYGSPQFGIALSVHSLFVPRPDLRDHMSVQQSVRGGGVHPTLKVKLRKSARREALREREMAAGSGNAQPTGKGILWYHPLRNHELLSVEVYDADRLSHREAQKGMGLDPRIDHLRRARFREDAKVNIGILTGLLATGLTQQCHPSLQVALNVLSQGFALAKKYNYAFEMAMYLTLEVRVRDYGHICGLLFAPEDRSQLAALFRNSSYENFARKYRKSLAEKCTASLALSSITDDKMIASMERVRGVHFTNQPSDQPLPGPSEETNPLSPPRREEVEERDLCRYDEPCPPPFDYDQSLGAEEMPLVSLVSESQTEEANLTHSASTSCPSGSVTRIFSSSTASTVANEPDPVELAEFALKLIGADIKYAFATMKWLIVGTSDPQAGPAYSAADAEDGVNNNNPTASSLQ